MDRAAWQRCRTPQENGVGGRPRRRIGANAGQAVALSSNQPDSRAPAAARGAKPVKFCAHRVPMVQRPSQHHLRRRKSRPCSPASVFCSPRSCCRCRYWCSGSVRRPCCARPTRNSPATLHGAWRRSRNLPSRTKRPARSPGNPRRLCWRCCASNRSRRSRRPRTAFRRPRRQPSHRRSPRCRMSPKKSPRWTPEDQPRRSRAGPKSRSRKLRCKARRRPPPIPAPARGSRRSRRQSRSCRRPMKSSPAPEPAIAPPAADTDIAATKIATLGGPPVAIETPPPAKAASAKPAQTRRRKRLAGAARQGAAQDRVARAAGGSATGRRSVRAADNHDPQPLISITPDRSRSAGRRAGPIRPTSRHTAPSRARRAGTAPASAPARRRRSRSWSRSVLSGRRRRPVKALRKSSSGFIAPVPASNNSL